MIEIKKEEKEIKETDLMQILMFIFVLNAAVCMNIIMMLGGEWIQPITMISPDINLKNMNA